MRSTALLATIALSLASAATHCAHAAQFLVRAGDDWSTLKEKVKPGDEIILMPGNHRPVRFDDLQGEPDKPITIKSPNPKTMAMIQATDIGIQLVRPKHVRIENVAVIGGRRGGIVIKGDSEGRAAHLYLLNVYVAKTGDVGERVGILIERTDAVTLKDCRVEAWDRAGVQLTDASTVALSSVQFVGSPGTADAYAVLIDGGSHTVLIERCRFAPGIGTAIAVGLPGISKLPEVPPPTPDAPKPPPPVLAKGITVERCLAKRATRFITFGSSAEVLVRANTIVDCTHAYAFAEAPRDFAPVTFSTFIANLVLWTPGVMKSFALVEGGAVPAGLSVESNLWYSAELPAAKPTLGEFPGTVKSPQILDVDPKLDGYDRPLEEKAKNFGWTSA